MARQCEAHTETWIIWGSTMDATLNWFQAHIGPIGPIGCTQRYRVGFSQVIWQ